MGLHKAESHFTVCIITYHTKICVMTHKTFLGKLDVLSFIVIVAIKLVLNLILYLRSVLCLRTAGGSSDALVFVL